MSTVATRYQALPFSNGFLLDGGEERPRVCITLARTCWWASVQDNTFSPPPPRRFGLFEVRPLIDCAAAWSMLHWQPRPGPAPQWRLHAWAQRQARRSIAFVVAEQRRRLMPRVEPIVRDVQRALFAATCTVGGLALCEEFYSKLDSFLLADLLRYRACAIAVRNFGERLLEDHVGAGGPLGEAGHDPAVVEAVCRQLCRWRDLFSDTGRSYGHLNRTLDRLPGGLSHHAVCLLSRAHLERPITDRLELAVYLLSLERRQQINRRVFQFAQHDEVRRAVQRVAAALRRPLSPRRMADLRLFVGHLADCPEPHRGNLVGLAERAIRWHRDEAQRQADETVAREGSERAVALPPVPLPTVPGLTFLDTVGAIAREGAVMGHCIGNYVPDALAGHSFLFHYEDGSESASIEVGADGRVRQAQGPGNSDNQAARRAARLLAEWGRAFPPAPSVAVPCVGDDEIPF